MALSTLNVIYIHTKTGTILENNDFFPHGDYMTVELVNMRADQQTSYQLWQREYSGNVVRLFSFPFNATSARATVRLFVHISTDVYIQEITGDGRIDLANIFLQYQSATEPYPPVPPAFEEPPIFEEPPFEEPPVTIPSDETLPPITDLFAPPVSTPPAFTLPAITAGTAIIGGGIAYLAFTKSGKKLLQRFKL